MYCIIYVIYGVYLTDKAHKALEKLGLEPEDVGCESLYSGGGGEYSPTYCGVELDRFDEATETGLKVSAINMAPTPAQIAQAKTLIAALPEEVKKHLPEPEVYFVFSTS